MILAVTLAVARGVTGIVVGEADDPPGLQLLGLVLAVGAVVVGVRTALRAALGLPARDLDDRAAPTGDHRSPPNP